MAMMLRGLLAVALALVAGQAARAQPNKFGVGVYDDTPGSAGATQQLDAAAHLVGGGGRARGAGGWVTLYLCSWRTHTTSCMNASTAALDEPSRAVLLAAYARGLRVVVRLGYPYFVRDHADEGARHLRYTALAAAYARVAASLPPPPGGDTLHVHAGNEFNACNEWRCSEAGANMTSRAMAGEVAGFSRDVMRALVALRASSASRYGFLRLAHPSIANWQNSACGCDGSPQGHGQPGD